MQRQGATPRRSLFNFSAGARLRRRSTIAGGENATVSGSRLSELIERGGQVLVEAEVPVASLPAES